MYSKGMRPEDFSHCSLERTKIKVNQIDTETLFLVSYLFFGELEQTIALISVFNGLHSFEAL